MGWIGEIILPKRVVQQPTPFVCPIGDCGACVLSGLTGISVEDVYKQDVKEKEYSALNGISRHRMFSHIYHYESLGLIDRYIRNIPFWFPYEDIMHYGAPATMFNLAWFYYLRMAMDAGYYALAEVDHDKKGGPTNHWVLLCGNRTYMDGNTFINEVLVSCSSRATPPEMWVRELDFLKNYGGFNCILVRPKC